jgi:hypothetical protein
MSEDIKNNNEVDLTNEDDVLKNIDAFIAEEDPDFVKSMADVKIDNSAVSLSVLDSALELSDGSPSTPSVSLKERLKQISFEVLAISDRSNCRCVLCRKSTFLG